MKKVIEMQVAVAFVLNARDFEEKGSALAEEQLLMDIRQRPGIRGATIVKMGEVVSEIPDERAHDHLAGDERCDRCGHTRQTAPMECCEMCARIKARTAGL